MEAGGSQHDKAAAVGESKDINRVVEDIDEEDA
jgi:hypothetical protein